MSPYPTVGESHEAEVKRRADICPGGREGARVDALDDVVEDGEVDAEERRTPPAPKDDVHGYLFLAQHPAQDHHGGHEGEPGDRERRRFRQSVLIEGLPTMAATSTNAIAVTLM
jgi:hypothetical protein